MTGEQLRQEQQAYMVEHPAMMTTIQGGKASE
jgi:hypothetical protein